MMNYDINSRLVLRVPRFPVKMSTLSLDILLQDPVFRNSLYLASDSLYNKLRSNDFDLNKCSDKMKQSLLKYQRRICYRPTPFGSFAGLGVLEFGESENSLVKVEEKSFKTQLMAKAPCHEINACRQYRVNPFLYTYGDDFRILTKTMEDGQTRFSISELFGNELIRQLVITQGTFTGEELKAKLLTNGCEIEDIENYIGQLIELQVVLPAPRGCGSFLASWMLPDEGCPGSSYDSYTGFAASGSLPRPTQDQLRQAVHCLDKLSRGNENGQLTDYKRRFEKLFDRQEIPLLHALDPELGIDYDKPDLSGKSDPGSATSSNISWTPLNELLLQKWTSFSGPGIPEIEISDEDLIKLENPLRHYPPGMSVLFTCLGDRLHVKAAGGVSSLNMIGRFTALDADVLALAKELAAKEMASNPDVVFAEISHIDSPDVATVNRKATVYNYQIPFFESPDLDDVHLIAVNDLYLSLVNGQFILRSARLNKQVVPRFSNAYNYHRSKLPVFRFLCDLQHEGLSSNLNFSMVSLFPGLQAYPRVVYKNVVLEAASWHLDAKHFIGLKKSDHAAQLTGFNTFADDIKLPKEFYYEVHDHLLHIDRSSESGIQLLLQSIPASGKIILREYFKDQEGTVQNGAGEAYTHECIAFLTNRETSYKTTAFQNKRQESSTLKKCKLLPFDEWLYFKIYLHPAGYSDLLLNYIQPFVKENLSKGNIVSWFFISYYEGDFHLRFRVKQVNGQEHRLLKSYKSLESKLRTLPNLKKIELATYFPELERYAAVGIHNAEKLFELSSGIVLSKLYETELVAEAERCRLFAAVRHLLEVFRALNFSLREIDGLSNDLLQVLSKPERINFDIEYRQYRIQLQQFLDEGNKVNPGEAEYLELMSIAVGRLAPDEKIRAVVDLNHMHLNRHYLLDQNLLEIKSYYFLRKSTGRLGRW